MNIFSFFLAGVLLSFTPCMWPTIPIVGLIVTKEGKLGALWYVLGAALTYAVIGAIAGYTGAFLQPYLQSPVVLYISAAFLFLLACIQFDIIPFSTIAILGKMSYNTGIGPFFLGIFATLILSPCITPALAVILGYITTTGDIVKGFFFLFVLSLGINFPLLIAGLLGSNLLPKGGEWMNGIKKLIGVVFIGLAFTLVLRTLPEGIDTFLPNKVKAVMETKLVAKAELKTVTVYTATWCPSCHDFIRTEVPKLRAAGVQVNMVDVSNGGPSSITGVPTIIAFKNGKQVATFVGFTDAGTILARLK